MQIHTFSEGNLRNEIPAQLIYPINVTTSILLSIFRMFHLQRIRRSVGSISDELDKF